MAFTYEKDSDGIVLLTIDMPNYSANVLNNDFFTAYSETLDRLQADDSATGVILISGKKLWIAGADIDNAFNSEDPKFFFEMSEKLKADLRRLETLSIPVVAALERNSVGRRIGSRAGLSSSHRH